eukprot:12026-Heterococcus_DN1.PRE.3
MSTVLPLLCSTRDVAAVLDYSASAVSRCSSSNTHVRALLSRAQYKSSRTSCVDSALTRQP